MSLFRSSQERWTSGGSQEDIELALVCAVQRVDVVIHVGVL